MAKSRFRDVKQGKQTVSKEKKSKSNEPKFISNGTFFKAFLTDSFMLLMPIMYIVFYLVFGGREGFGAHKTLGWVYILVPLAIVETIFLIKSAQTPGMKAYGAKLISLKTGQKPSALIILMRQLLSKITFLIFGWIVIFLNRKHRNLHDFILNTALVYDDSKK